MYRGPWTGQRAGWNRGVNSQPWLWLRQDFLIHEIEHNEIKPVLMCTTSASPDVLSSLSFPAIFVSVPNQLLCTAAVSFPFLLHLTALTSRDRAISISAAVLLNCNFPIFIGKLNWDICNDPRRKLAQHSITQHRNSECQSNGSSKWSCAGIPQSQQLEFKTCLAPCICISHSYQYWLVL